MIRVYLAALYEALFIGLCMSIVLMLAAVLCTISKPDTAPKPLRAVSYVKHHK